MLKAFVASCAIGAISTPASAEFILDLSPGEVRKAAGEIIVRDLVIGDEAHIYTTLCHYENQAYVDGDWPVLKQISKSSHSVKVRKIPGGSFEMTVIPGESPYETREAFIAALLARSWDTPCEGFKNDPSRYFPISSFDGKSRSSDVLKAQ